MQPKPDKHDHPTRRLIKPHPSFRTWVGSLSRIFRPAEKNAWIKPTLMFFSGLLALLLLAGFWALWRYAYLSPRNLWQIVFFDTQELKQHKKRTNVLVLGRGGENHEGGDLTDTLMVVSIDLDQQGADMVLISLPRDIWIPSLKDKINAAYRLGEEKRVGGGLILAKAAVEEVVGLPIHYAVLLDFNGFIELIDLLSGINVKINETFTDEFYPVAGRENDPCDGDPEYRCRYEIVTFVAGVEHMNGSRALKYVRSRHAEGDQGTDFSRGKRQQAVIIALKVKILDINVWSDFALIRQLLSVATDSITTDMSMTELLLVGRKLAGDKNVRSLALTQDEPEKDKVGLLINPPQWQYDGKWVLTPKYGDFSRIARYIDCEINELTDCQRLIE